MPPPVPPAELIPANSARTGRDGESRRKIPPGVGSGLWEWSLPTFLLGFVTNPSPGWSRVPAEQPRVGSPRWGKGIPGVPAAAGGHSLATAATSPGAPREPGSGESLGMIPRRSIPWCIPGGTGTAEGSPEPSLVVGCKEH